MADDIAEIESTSNNVNIKITLKEDTLEIPGGTIIDSATTRKIVSFTMTVDGKEVGQAIVVRPPEKDQHVFTIHRLATKPEEREKGYGIKLLQGIEEWALTQSRDIGGVAMVTLIRPDDLNDEKRLIEFYKSQEYHPSKSNSKILTKFLVHKKHL